MIGPPVRRFAIDVGPFTLTGTAPPVDGESYAFTPRHLLKGKPIIGFVQKALFLPRICVPQAMLHKKSISGFLLVLWCKLCNTA
jgi:hypothetical protein